MELSYVQTQKSQTHFRNMGDRDGPDSEYCSAFLIEPPHSCDPVFHLP